jgi:hypothetical protein
MIPLNDVKRIFDQDIRDIKQGAIGFRISDLFALFKGKIKTNGKVGRDDWKKLARTMNKPFKGMNKFDKTLLRKFSLSYWDIVEAGSGGHKDITNISGLNFIGKGYVDFVKKLQAAFAKEMSTKRLKT